MYHGIVIDDERWAIPGLLSAVSGQKWFAVLHEAHNGFDGLNMLVKFKPEIAFIDTNLPGIGGLEVLRRAREKGLSTKVILVSNRADFSYAKEAIFYDASGYCLKPYSKQDLTCCMEKIYRQLNAAYSSSRFDGITENKLVLRMLEYISSHYNEEITVNGLAKMCSINPNYAGQIFKRETGETAVQYLTRLRMNEAVRRLIYTKDNVAAIAFELGYKDSFYFAKVFKRLTGQTPSEFRAGRPGTQEIMAKNYKFAGRKNF